MLWVLRSLDPDRCGIVSCYGWFLYGQQICLEFELLDISVWDFVGQSTLPLREIRIILEQVCQF